MKWIICCAWGRTSRVLPVQMCQCMHSWSVSLDKFQNTEQPGHRAVCRFAAAPWMVLLFTAVQPFTHVGITWLCFRFHRAGQDLRLCVSKAVLMPLVQDHPLSSAGPQARSGSMPHLLARSLVLSGARLTMALESMFVAGWYVALGAGEAVPACCLCPHSSCPPQGV